MRATGLASSTATSLQPALIAGRYRTEAALGKGGAAQVYRVTDLASGAELALKRLNPSASRELAALFEREYQTLASLNHPGTVEVFDYGRDEETAYYTMELLHGEDLKARSPMPWREACGYLRDAAQTLGLLHSRKLIHRDVSPRNLWRMPNGRAKLIDFGALMPFGNSDHLMGTPPLMAPEALRGEQLDQRADLYSLGAVGYYLLAGVHAFPAREFDDLPVVWSRGLTPVSDVVAQLGRAELEPIPAELDQLLTSLLSQDMLARPSNTPELIDRLDTLLGQTRPSQIDAAELHLSNTAFVGHVAALRSLRRQLQVAARGRCGQSTVLEGEPGMGRSRLLKELALEARVLPATVLHVHAANYPGLYGVATALALRLLDALPAAARAAALPHANLLAHASPRLGERLSIEPLRATEAVELRVRIQAAFREWFLQLAKEHPLVVLVDGFEQVDDGSGAFLLSLALARKPARLLLVCSLPLSHKRAYSALERALLKTSYRRKLVGLSESQALALLHSVFGGAEHLARLASRVQRATRGNPGHMLELCGQLVRNNVIGFSQGSWLLPQEVSPQHLASTREQALSSRLAQLSTGARQLARVLSLYAGELPMALVQALAATVSDSALMQLPTLLDEEIVARAEDGLQFVHETLREQLALELTPLGRAAAQRAIGRYLLAIPSPSLLDRLTAGVHLLSSGDARGADLIARASLRFALGEPAQLSPALPLLEEALRLFRAEKRPLREQVSLLSALSMAGYYSDRRYAIRYGDVTVSALSELVGLPLARRLRGFWGPKLGLLLALAVSAVRVGLRRANPRVPRFSDALLMLFSCVGTLAGSSAVCLDPDGAERYRDVLAPFKALGPRHLASFVYEYCSVLAASLRDGWGDALARWLQLLRSLDRGDIQGMPPTQRARFLSGALFASGVLQAHGDGKSALATADRLEQLGMALDRLSADQVRTMFYAHQGDAERYADFGERVEQHAIQLGTSWQIETWSASSKSAVDLRTHDVMGVKQASEQLQRLSQTIPTLDLAARRARGTYLMMRKKYAEALPWLEECLREEPLSSAGWGLMHGVLARTYNRLGDHERARAVCLRALLVLKPNDFVLAGMYLLVQTEVLVAEAGLGRAEEAQRALLALIQQHEPEHGPLTMGQLHEAGVDIAVLVHDPQAAQFHLEQTKYWYLQTGVASLVQRCAALTVRLSPRTEHSSVSRVNGGESITASDTLSVEGDSASSNTIDRMLAGTRMSTAERAHKALQILAEHARSTHGALYLLDERAKLTLTAALKDEPEVRAIKDWVERRVASELEDELTVDDGDAALDMHTRELHVLHEGGRAYRVLMLVAAGAKPHGIVGAAVLGSSEGVPSVCAGEVATAVAFHLLRGRQREQASNSASS